MPVAPFTPVLEYDGGNRGLCRLFMEDIRADFFDGAPYVASAKRYRKTPRVFADPLSDTLVAQENPENQGFESLTRYWGDLDGDGSSEEVAMTAYIGDGASGYRTFV